jgi:hypothetical protein
MANRFLYFGIFDTFETEEGESTFSKKILRSF